MNGDPDDSSVCPDEVLYLVSGIQNCDGTIDWQCETPNVFATEREAIAFVKGDEHDCEWVIYRITPIWQRRRKMVMQRVKP